MNIVLLETVSNQGFVFASNKLREAVGASEMILRAGTQLFLEAVDEIRGTGREQGLRRLWNQREELYAALTGHGGDTSRNPPIEAGGPIEVIVTASGKSLALVRSPEIGRELVQRVTLRVAKKMPGLALHGAVSDCFELGQRPIHEMIRDVHRKHEAARSDLSAVEQRYARLPVVAGCATSGLPAAEYRPDVAADQRMQPRAAVTVAKRRLGFPHVTEARARRLLGNMRLATDLEGLEEEFEWFGVIHADGNGFGRIFQEFHKHAQAEKPDQYRPYVNALREFSLQLDHCTQAALRDAVIWYVKQRPVRDDEGVKFVPLVVAGDDLTVMCDGQLAAQWAVEFLRHFEQLSADVSRFPRLVEIADRAFGRPGLAACAGVAVVKPHFPFHAAYDLAEDLATNAKLVKRMVFRTPPEKPETACSALDVYVHTMSSNADLAAIRDELYTDASVLFGGPYIVSDDATLAGISDDSRRWIEPRKWSDLAARVELLGAADPDEPDRRWLPSSLLHRIREALHEGRDQTDGYINLIRHRYNALQELMNGDPSLFWSERRLEFEGQQDSVRNVTAMLDALSLMKLWSRSTNRAEQSK